MKKPLLITLLITLVIASTAFYLFPQAPELPDQSNLAITFAILVIQAVAVWAFLTSLKAFKKALKRAYYLLAAGIFLLALNQMQLPLTSFITIDPVALSWFIALSSLTGTLLMYLSMYKFAKLLEVKSRPWGSLLFATGFALALALGSTFLPHIDFPDLAEWVIDGVFGSYIAAAGYAIAAAALALQIRGKLGDRYKGAMGWLVVGLIVLAFSSFHETAIRLLPIFAIGSFDWYSLYGFSLLPLLLMALLLLGASLSFRKLSKESTGLPENATYLDVIQYVARLVSKPEAIDVTLDKVREITAMQGDTTPLSSAHQTVLVGVYLQLEDYLVMNEPLLRLSREELRSRLPETFIKDVSKRKEAINDA